MLPPSLRTGIRKCTMLEIYRTVLIAELAEYPACSRRYNKIWAARRIRVWFRCIVLTN